MRFVYCIIAMVLICSQVMAGELRLWTLADGKTVEAKFITTMGGLLTFKTARGKTVKFKKALLCEADKRYLDLAFPPEFELRFTEKSTTVKLQSSPYSSYVPPNVNDYEYGVDIKQKNPAISYNYELTVEYFAIGMEAHGSAYILLDRGKSTFTPSAENNYSFSFSGEKVEMMVYTFRSELHGRKNKGYLITLTDCEGRIIDHNATNEFLFENLEKLKKIPKGMFFDKNCERRRPTRIQKTS